MAGNVKRILEKFLKNSSSFQRFGKLFQRLATLVPYQINNYFQPVFLKKSHRRAGAYAPYVYRAAVIVMNVVLNIKTGNLPLVISQ